MADATLPFGALGTRNSKPDTDPRASGDVLVTIWPDAWASYSGSRAQLEAEGVIPAGLEWPKGRADVSWEAGGMHFTLHRCRPDGMKGPMKLWIEGDYWRLSIDVPRATGWHSQRCIEQKVRALNAEIHRQSDAGRREWDDNRRRYWTAYEDESFQAFKAKCPGLVKQRRGMHGGRAS